MSDIKKIILELDVEQDRDRNIYHAICDFKQKRHLVSESDALKSFMIYLHFLASDVKELSGKLNEYF